ncbi:MAG: hypothetical protein IKR41_11705 [Bacteroidales bacterium]|nr:hypothetical protein [Bacteroidales bacterium]
MKKKTTKIELHHPYTKVGRLKATIAQKAHLKCADIYVSENYLRHIQTKHGKELGTLGILPIDFVRLICDNFNEIRKGSDNSVLIVMFNKRLSYVAGIALNYSVEKDFWDIKTAEPRRLKAIEKKALIWSAAKHTDNGNGNRSN